MVLGRPFARSASPSATSARSASPPWTSATPLKSTRARSAAIASPRRPATWLTRHSTERRLELAGIRECRPALLAAGERHRLPVHVDGIVGTHDDEVPGRRTPQRRADRRGLVEHLVDPRRPPATLAARRPDAGRHVAR